MLLQGHDDDNPMIRFVVVALDFCGWHIVVVSILCMGNYFDVNFLHGVVTG